MSFDLGLFDNFYCLDYFQSTGIPKPAFISFNLYLLMDSLYWLDSINLKVYCVKRGVTGFNP